MEITGMPSDQLVVIDTLVTPAMAEEWLGKNTMNRRTSNPHVQRLVASFGRGEVKKNGQTIKFSKSGRLLDGQHRLLACSISGISFETLVVYGLDDDVFSTIDTHARARSVSDVLGIRNEISTKALAATLKILFCFCRSGGQFYDGGGSYLAYGFSAQVAQQILKVHPDIRDSVAEVYGKELPWRCAAAAALHFLFMRANAEVACDFLTVLRDGSDDPLRPYNVFRKLIEHTPIKSRSTRRLAAIAVKAFNAECNGTRVKNFVWTPNSAYPQILGLDISSLGFTPHSGS